MKFMNMHRKYYSPAGDGGDSGGGAATGDDGDAETVTFTQEQVNEMVGGLKSKNSELLGKLKEQKTAVTETSEQLKQFDGIDPQSVKAILQRFSDDEESKLIAEGKIDEVLNKRTQNMKDAHSKELEKISADLENARTIAEKFTDRVLADSIRASGTEIGIHKAAYEDAIYRAKGAFEVSETGEIIAKEGMLDSKGQPLTPKAWFESMKESAPHWFPAPQGGGMGNNASGSASRGSLSGSKEDREAYWTSKFKLPN